MALSADTFLSAFIAFLTPLVCSKYTFLIEEIPIVLKIGTKLQYTIPNIVLKVPMDALPDKKLIRD